MLFSKKITVLFFILCTPMCFASQTAAPVENLTPEEIHEELLENIPEENHNQISEDKQIQPSEKTIKEKTEQFFEEAPVEKSEEIPEEKSEINKKSSAAPKKYINLPFEGMDRPEVESFRQMYLSEKWSSLLYDYLEQAMEYRLYVRKAVADNNLPEILEYLPVVESNYKTRAKSKSGAIGMWQFMANSVYPFLTLNDYVDERLDPWKSTDAALKKLTENYNYFNDWLIGIAAYNCGVGAMSKYLKKSQEKNFWALVDKKILPKQTAQYVPKLLAIADLAINSEYYGIELPDHKKEFDILVNEKNGLFDYITVSKAYSINSLAQAMRLDSSTLKQLNPSFVLGFTHPSKKSEIRLPLGMKESAENALQSIEPIEFPIKYKVIAGDSLWSISRSYKVSIQSICELNNIEENAILRIGKILYIPSK